MQSYVQKQSAHIDTFPMELKFCRQCLKGIRPLFRGVQVVFSKKAFFSNHPTPQWRFSSSRAIGVVGGFRFSLLGVSSGRLVGR